LAQPHNLAGRNANLLPHGDVLRQDALKLKTVHRQGGGKLTSNAVVARLEGFRDE
jgi:hypothetical protein